MQPDVSEQFFPSPNLFATVGKETPRMAFWNASASRGVVPYQVLLQFSRGVKDTAALAPEALRSYVLCTLVPVDAALASENMATLIAKPGIFGLLSI